LEFALAPESYISKLRDLMIEGDDKLRSQKSFAIFGSKPQNNTLRSKCFLPYFKCRRDFWNKSGKLN